MFPFKAFFVDSLIYFFFFFRNEQGKDLMEWLANNSSGKMVFWSNFMLLHALNAIIEEEDLKK